MDVRLKEILTKINIDNSHHIYFETGKFTNLTYNKEKKIYSITLTVDDPIPASVYVATLESFQTYLRKEDPSVLVALYIKLNKQNFDCKIVKDYITFYVDCKVKNKEDYQFLKQQSMNIRNNEITITYDSDVLEKCLLDLKVKLERFIAAAGFDYLRINLVYIEPEEENFFDYEKDKEEYEKLLSKFKELKAIEEENKKQMANKQTNNFVRRPSFKNKTFTRVELDNIPKDIVEIEVEVKVLDVIAEGKNNKKFKLNFTNYKTSYTAHVWANKTNNTPEALMDLKGKWALLKGTLSYHQFDKEESLELYTFEVLVKVDEVRVDDSDVKRV